MMSRSKQAGLPGYSSSCLMRDIVNKTVHVVITGRVQGVAYRYWTQSEALRRELTGFVRNRWDGNVEAMFCGDENQVESMVSACWNGPPMASVRHIEIKAADEPAQATSFEILATV